jgi:hypothetical protein
MPQRPSASYLSYSEPRATARDTVVVRRLGRLALAAWAAAIYVVYWLAQLGPGVARVGGQ